MLYFKKDAVLCLRLRQWMLASGPVVVWYLRFAVGGRLAGEQTSEPFLPHTTG